MKHVTIALVLTGLSIGCSGEFTRGPAAPSAVATLTTPSATISWDQALRSSASAVTNDHHLPGPTNFHFLVSGTTVFLGWQAAPGNVSQYLIEAGSGPTLANIAVFGSGSAATGVAVTAVPTGVYYVRLRAIVDGQVSAVSNEIVVSVGGVCPAQVAPSNVQVPRLGGVVPLAVTTGCSWSAVSNSPFITVSSGASGLGNGIVVLNVSPNTGAVRTGLLVVAGQNVLITQASGSLHVAFELFDPATQLTPTTECRINGNPSRCVLRSVSFPFGTTAIANYAWTVQYTYAGEIRTRTQSGANPEFTFTDVCGLLSSAPEGAAQPLSVALTITDTAGDTATAISGTFGQPALQLRLYSCP
jgi:hypothetical protein